MASSDQAATNNNAAAAAASSSTSTTDQSLKLAVAISLLRSKLLQKQTPPESDALRWKQKAKVRKQEILRLREDLKEAEDTSQRDLFPQNASCKCFFFDNLGEINPNQPPQDASHRRFNDVLRRRFLRQVRLKERRKRTDGSNQRMRFSELNSEDEAERLRASVDFLVELCDTASPAEEANFANWSHQAVDFILASLRNLLATGNKMELIEGIVSSLIMRLVRRMCSLSHGVVSYDVDTDAQCYIQHLIRKLGSEPYIGQRTILSVSQQISVVAENLLFLDPFDDAFPNIHGCLFIMIQLIEFLLSDYLLSWSKDGSFDIVLLEEWITSVLQARKALEVLESRNGIYVLYMDRVIGQLAKQVSQVPSLQQLNRDILDNLFC